MIDGGYSYGEHSIRLRLGKSLCCTSESNVTLCINDPRITKVKKKFFKHTFFPSFPLHRSHQYFYSLLSFHMLKDFTVQTPTSVSCVLIFSSHFLLHKASILDLKTLNHMEGSFHRFQFHLREYMQFRNHRVVNRHLWKTWLIVYCPLICGNRIFSCIARCDPVSVLLYYALKIK